MKSVITLMLLVFGLYSSAQSVSTSVRFNKADRPALLLYLSYSPEVAEGTILTKLKEIGFEPETKTNLFWKQNKVDGFYAFKGVVLKGEKNELVDLYFKVDRRGSKKEDQSVMYMMTSKGGDNFIDGSTPPTYAAAQKFLNGFVNETASYKRTLDVKTQEETVKKSETKLQELLDSENELNSKIGKLQEELKKNKEMQNNQQALIEAEKKKLGEMRSLKQ
jgi:hypothetical protein